MSQNSPCKTKKCGCEDQGLTTPTPCVHDTFECPNPDPCAETFSACCVIFNQPSIPSVGFNNGDNLCTILEQIANLFTNPIACCSEVYDVLSTGEFLISDEEFVYGNCYFVIPAGRYTLDAHFEYLPTSDGITSGSVKCQIITNTNTLAVTAGAPGDIIRATSNNFTSTTNAQTRLSCGVISTSFTTAVPLIVKMAFVDITAQVARVSNMFLRAIKVGN